MKAKPSKSQARDRATFTSSETAELARALGGGELRCPRCDGVIARQAVPTPLEVSYVRSRIWLKCNDCGSHAVVDAPPGRPR